MAAETLVALALVAVVAFLAGWLARGRADDAQPTDPEIAVAAEPIGVQRGQTPPRHQEGLTPSVSPGEAPDAAKATLRLLDRAVAAYEAAVERWLDDSTEVTPAGKAALGELDRAIQRVDVAAARIEEGAERRLAALDALDALREAAKLLQGYRDGRAIDAATSRELDRLEDEIGHARTRLAD